MRVGRIDPFVVDRKRYRIEGSTGRIAAQDVVDSHVELLLGKIDWTALGAVGGESTLPVSLGLRCEQSGFKGHDVLQLLGSRGSALGMAHSRINCLLGKI